MAVTSSGSGTRNATWLPQGDPTSTGASGGGDDDDDDDEDEDGDAGWPPKKSVGWRCAAGRLK